MTERIPVPDGCRHRLAHEAEKSLAVLGVRDAPLGDVIGTAQTHIGRETILDDSSPRLVRLVVHRARGAQAEHGE